MSNTIIIIPTRLEAKRLPNKPLLKINNKPMIIHVIERARESNVGEVVVATPDDEIAEIVTKNSCRAIITSKSHNTGTDRIHEALQKLSTKDIDIVINLQGDMPNLDGENIKTLNFLMKKNKCKVGTLASKIQNKEELENRNIVKVETFEELNHSNFLRVKDFFREAKGIIQKNVYHHIGIYAFTKDLLFKYVKLKRTSNEIERNLEQLRIMDNKIEIYVSLTKSLPLSVDTKEEFLLIKKTMEYK